MARSFASISALLAHGYDDLVDVRSPAEFAEDHVPDAISLPVLSNDERARVGTVYKQVSPFDARKIGAALVARNAARHIESTLADREGGWRPLVYCWRGGQRSNSFASILKAIGWQAETLEGGYRQWRRLVVECLYDGAFPAPLVLLDGNTGTAKTALLARLSANGVQTIDLEGLAGHRGSVLGRVGPQPSQKAFESALAQQVALLDPSRPVVVEAESVRIGQIILPPVLVEAMRVAERFEISAPIEARATYLVAAYNDALQDRDAFADRIGHLKRVRGAEMTRRWAEMVRSGAFFDVASELMVQHYDPAYRKSREKRAGRAPIVFETDGLGEADLTVLARKIAGQLMST